MFLAPNFLGGVAPEFLNLPYKIQPGFDHVAKVQSDRPRTSENARRKKERKHHGQNIRPPVLPYGRPNKQVLRMTVNYTLINVHLE